MLSPAMVRAKVWKARRKFAEADIEIYHIHPLDKRRNVNILECVEDVRGKTSVMMSNFPLNRSV